jgi:hypothetical protein
VNWCGRSSSTVIVAQCGRLIKGRACGSRIRGILPSRTVREVLIETKKYSAEQVNKVLGLCGTGLGLLSPFLKATEDQVRPADWVEETLQSHIKDAVAALEDFGKREAIPENKKKRRRILDNTVADIRYRKGEWFPEGSIPRDMLPKVFKEPFPTDVLLRGPGRSVLFFQSAAVRHAWHHVCDKNAWGVAPTPGRYAAIEVARQACV